MRKKRRTRRKSRRRKSRRRKSRRRFRRRRRHSRRMRGGMRGLFKNYVSEKAFPPGSMYKAGCSEPPCGTFYGYQCKTSCHPKSTVGQMFYKGGRKSRRRRRRRKIQRGGQVGKSISPSRSTQLTNKIGTGLRSFTPTPIVDSVRHLTGWFGDKYNHYQGSRVGTSANVMDQPIKYQMRGNINNLSQLEGPPENSSKKDLN